MGIANLDKNFTVESDLGKDDIAWYNVKSEPFEIYGLANDAEKPFSRMPRRSSKVFPIPVGPAR